MGRAVAIKSIEVSLCVPAGVSETLGEVKNEASFLYRIRHPNIVTFLGVSFNNTSISLQVCLVLELCARSLADEIFDTNNFPVLGWKQTFTYLLETAQVNDKILQFVYRIVL